MYFTLGSYSTPVNSSWFSISTQAFLSPRKKKIGEKQMWNIHTVLLASTQAALDTLIADHESGMKQENVDLTFYKDDGSLTAHRIVNSNTLNGITFKGISYPGYFPGMWGSGSEYAAGSALRYVVTSHEADVLDVEDNILFYWQALQFSLGGADYKAIGALTGPPQVQFTMQQSPAWAVQTGTAIGMFTNPNPADPMFSIPVKPDGWVKPETPKNFGRVRNWGYPTTWYYPYESAGSLAGVPPENP